MSAIIYKVHKSKYTLIFHSLLTTFGSEFWVMFLMSLSSRIGVSDIQPTGQIQPVEVGHLACGDFCYGCQDYCTGTASTHWINRAVTAVRHLLTTPVFPPPNLPFSITGGYKNQQQSVTGVSHSGINSLAASRKHDPPTDLHLIPLL